MQHINRVADIQPLAAPERYRGPRAQNEILSTILRSQDVDRVGRCRQRARYFGQEPPIRTAEPQLTVVVAVDLVTLLVNGTMMPSTQHGQIRERRRSSLHPMFDVMALADAHATARKATTVASMVYRASSSCRNRQRPRRDFNDSPPPRL